MIYTHTRISEDYISYSNRVSQATWYVSTSFLSLFGFLTMRARWLTLDTQMQPLMISLLNRYALTSFDIMTNLPPNLSSIVLSYLRYTCLSSLSSFPIDY